MTNTAVLVWTPQEQEIAREAFETAQGRAISTLVDNYFAPNTVIQAGYPLDMRYAGPREALLHAVFRQNYGCSHLIVGRAYPEPRLPLAGDLVQAKEHAVAPGLERDRKVCGRANRGFMRTHNRGDFLAVHIVAIQSRVRRAHSNPPVYLLSLFDERTASAYHFDER
jgi:hypothetical protein